MNTETLGQAEFDRMASESGALIVEFGAQPSAAFVAVAREHAHKRFLHVAPNESPAIAAMFGVRDGPALLILRQKVVLYLAHVQHTAEQIAKLLEQAEALDMDAVRRALQAERDEEALMMRRVCPAMRRAQPGE